MDAINQADLIVFLFVIYFTCLGWVQGIMRFALALAAVMISGQIALTSFRGSYDLVESLKIFFLLSAGLSVLLWIGLSIWNRMIVKSKKCTFLSRILGATVGFGWSLTLALAIMFFLTMIQVNGPFLKKAKRLTKESYTYTLAESQVFSRYPIYQALKKMHEQPELASQISDMTTEKAEEDGIVSFEETQAIYQDQKLQEILQDEKIQKMIEEKDIAHLFANPKIQALLRDKDFVKKLLNFYSRLSVQNP